MLKYRTWVGVCVALVGCFVTPALGQLRWVQRPTASHPPTALNASVYSDNPMTYDPDRRVCVWTNAAETWEYDGNTWTRRPHDPLPVYAGLGVTYDSARHRTLLISFIPSPPRVTTYEWDGVSWTQRVTTGGSSMQGRVEYFVQYDPVRNVTVLAGGQNGVGGIYFDTWELAGTVWTQNGASPVFTGHAMVYDSARSTMILYAPDPSSGPTYERPNPNAWTFRMQGPSRLDASMVYDSSRQRAVLFGGLLSFGVPSNQMWEYNGASWSQSALTGPSARRSVAMAYDSTRGVIVLYGGRHPNGTNYTDTWELAFCPADFNRSGAADSQDFFSFLDAFFADSIRADVNLDHTVNSQDFFEFLGLFFAGCG